MLYKPKPGVFALGSGQLRREGHTAAIPTERPTGGKVRNSDLETDPASVCYWNKLPFTPETGDQRP